MLEIIAIAVAAQNKFGFMGKLAKLARVGCYGSALSLVVGAVTLHNARAAYREQSLELGQDLMPLASLFDETHTFTMNGQKVHVSTSRSEDSLGRVLDRVEENCRENGDEGAAVLHDMPTVDDVKDHKVDVLPILRHENPKSGVVICFVHGEKMAGPTLNERLQAFVETGDMGKVGKVRYVYAALGKHGTSVITVWTDDTFDVMALVPADGVDAKGEDPRDIPRPASTTRFVTVGDDKGGLRSYGYVSHDAPAKVTADYDLAMKQQGWKLVHASQDDKDGARSLAYARDGKQAFVSVRVLPGSKTGIFLGEAQGVGALRVGSAHDADGF